MKGRHSLRSRSRHNHHRRRPVGAKPVRLVKLDIEGLEDRLAPAVSTTLNFQIPAAVASMGVQVGIYSNTGHDYLPSSGASYQPIPASGTLPLINLTPAQPYSAAITVPVTMPAQAFDNGVVVMFVGTVFDGLAIKSGTIATPTPSTNAADTFSLLEIDYNGGAGANFYDADISSVDQVGIPFTMTSTADPAVTPYPLTQVGITLDQSDLFKEFNATTAGTSFAQCATWHIGTSSQRLIAPQDILTGENAYQGASPITMQSATLANNGTGGLQPGVDYYYVVTAYSSSTIVNSQINGESLPANNPMDPGTIPAGSNNSSVQLSWSAFQSPTTTGYNIYRGIGGAGGAAPPMTYSLVARVAGVANTSFQDLGTAPLTPLQQITPSTASNYGFNSLSDYFTTSIQQFFSYYATHDFTLDIPTDGTEWTGRTTVFQSNTGGTTTSYTVLQMHNVAVPAQVVNIYEPFFNLNSRFVSNVTTPPPAMPSWMTSSTSQGLSPYESPGQMVFACDGVFATASQDVSKTWDPEARAQGSAVTTDLAAMENSIASAFNRGIATDFNLSPKNWAAAPSLSQSATVSPDAKSTLAANTYYYAVTAINADGETTPSLITSAGHDEPQAVTLIWTPMNPGTAVAGATGFNTATPTFTVRGSLPIGLAAGQTIYLTGIAGISPLAGLTLTAVNAAASSFTVQLPAALTGSYTGGGMLSQTPTVKAPAAIGFNIYRGTTPGNLTLLATVANGPATVHNSFTDDGFKTPSAQAVANVYYPANSASNTYAEFLHGNSTLSPQTGVSVNGLAYGFAFDDQSGLSTNVGFNQPPAACTITIGSFTQPALAFTTQTANLLNAGVNAPYQQAIGTDSPMGSTLTFAVVGGTLPSWLSLNSTTGTLSGTPGAGAAGAVDFSLRVADNMGDSALAAFSFNVVPFSILTRSVADADAGFAYDQLIATFGGSGGNTFSLANGSLPMGLSLDPATGLISGTTTQLGNLGFTIAVADSMADQATASGLNITVNPALAIPTSTLPAASVATPYLQSIPTTGGDGVVVFSAANLPSWLTLNASTGVVSGTPPAAGTVTFSVTATDNLGGTATQQLGITVNGASVNTPPPAPLSQPSTVSLVASESTAVPGQPVTYTVVVTGLSTTPTGTVTIVGINGVSLVVPLTAGTATFQVAAPIGTDIVSALYNGDASNLPSTSPSLTLLERIIAVQPSGVSTGSTVIAVGTTAGKKVITLRKHGKRIVITLSVPGSRRAVATTTIMSANVGQLTIYGTPFVDRVMFRGGLRLPVNYQTPVAPLAVTQG